MDEHRYSPTMLKLLESYRPIRKTEGAQPKVSVSDVLGAISGYRPCDGHSLWRMLCQRHPDLVTLAGAHKFPGQGQRHTPVIDVSAVAVLAALVQGKVAAQRRREMLAAEPQAVQNEMLDAESLLRERGYNSQECSRLAAELGRDLRLVAASEGREIHTTERHYGPDVRHVAVFPRSDGRLIEDVLSSFRERPLYQRVMASEPITQQRWQVLQAMGRGRARSRSTRRA